MKVDVESTKVPVKGVGNFTHIFLLFLQFQQFLFYRFKQKFAQQDFKGFGSIGKPKKVFLTIFFNWLFIFWPMFFNQIIYFLRCYNFFVTTY